MSLPAMTRLLVGLSLTPLATAVAANEAAGGGAAQASTGAPLTVTLDPAKAGAPISPFIYGQFIEHLGRCIYGGIWAEMLEDRKFYFPITAHYAPYKSLQDSAFPVVGASPWQILGEPAGVAMQRDGAYVGEHSPRLNAGAGIRQLDLGVVAQREYVGYLWAKPLGAAAEVEVTLAWGDSPTARAATKLRFSGSDFSQQTFHFTVGENSDHARLEILVRSGDVLLGPPSLMPADNVHGLRRDTLALLKELNGTVYRWPGGNFVSGYNWRDGIGARDKRPPRKNPAWTGVEHNDFGTDEFLAFCREIGTEPMIAVNTGFGDAYSAAQWVEYCNSSTDTIGGGWRAKNGHAAPYGVKYWCVGNEMWGPWQLGFMQLEQYVLKHNEVAQAMWAVDPKAKLAAVGDLETINKLHDPNQVKRNVTFTYGMLEGCADYMTYISEHFYCGKTPWSKDERPDLLTQVGMLKAAIKKKADGHRAMQASLPNLKGRVIPIAMDEWNYWDREYQFGELGCRYDLSHGLGTAMGLHEYYRQSDIIQMAHYAQTVNVIGAIKTSKTAAEMETTGLVLQMHRAHFGQIPFQLGDTFGPLDVAAALTTDKRTLTVSVVNPTKEARVLDLKTASLAIASDKEATRWSISGKDEFAHNAPGTPRQVNLVRDAVPAGGKLVVAPMSNALFVLPLK